METDSCRLVRSTESYQGQQGLTYLLGLTAASAGTRSICMTVVTLPPGARARTHRHRGIETAVHVIEGETGMYFGDRLTEHMVARAGDYIYIPADVPHLVHNHTDVPCRAVVAHSAPDDQQGIELLPELDRLV
jgi:uncharacterized RmlC-like cupin family protein